MRAPHRAAPVGRLPAQPLRSLRQRARNNVSRERDTKASTHKTTSTTISNEPGHRFIPATGRQWHLRWSVLPGRAGSAMGAVAAQDAMRDGQEPFARCWRGQDLDLVAEAGDAVGRG